MNHYKGKGKFWDIPDHLIGKRAKRIKEDRWFDVQQPLLKWLANTDFGRDLLCIDKNLPKITKFYKNAVQADIGGATISDIRVGSKWGNVIRNRWPEFQKAAQFYYEHLPSRVPVLFPVVPQIGWAYTVTTIYPDANPETSSVDGTARREGQNEVWSSMVTGTGTSAGDTDTNGVFVNVDATTTSNQYLQNYRYLILFDSSVIGAGQTVSAAEIDLAGDGTAEQAALALTNYVVVTSNPASNTALVGSDYQTTGTTANSGTFALASWNQTSGAYNTHALDSTGISNVTVTGVSKFAFVFDKDRTNTAPTWSSSGNAYIQCFFADAAGTTTDPKLVVTHAAASTLRSFTLLGVGT